MLCEYTSITVAIHRNANRRIATHGSGRLCSVTTALRVVGSPFVRCRLKFDKLWGYVETSLSLLSVFPFICCSSHSDDIRSHMSS